MDTVGKANNLSCSTTADGFEDTSLKQWLRAISRPNLLVVGRDASALSETLRGLESSQRPHHFEIDEVGTTFQLPYPSASFNLVVLNHPAADYAISRSMLAEIRRVTAVGGHLILIDLLVPGTRLRGKKARLLREAGGYINAWFRLRNPSHQCLLDDDHWQQQLTEAAWNIVDRSTRELSFDFDAWLHAFPLSDLDAIRLRAMLVQAPENVRRFLTPSVSNARIAFRMTELFVLAAAANRLA